MLPMTPLRAVRQAIEVLACHSRHLSKASGIATQERYYHHNPTEPDRTRKQRLLGRLLCLRSDDACSYPPASIRLPAQEDNRRIFLTKAAYACLDWLKRKFQCGTEYDEELYARFSAVIDSIDFDTLPEYMSSLRHLECSGQADKTVRVKCEIGMEPLFGSYHVLFPVTFSDGVEWLLKVPAAGCSGCWNTSAARSLMSEALTMRLLKNKTSVPVPAVYKFDSTLDNPVGCPFILMDRLEEWYNGFESSTAQERFRERVLQTLATAMVELNTLVLSHAGAPSFDDNGQLQTVGPVRVFNAPAMHAKMLSAFYDDEKLFCEVGPHNTSKAYFLSMLDGHRWNPRDKAGKGLNLLLRQFIDWIPHGLESKEETFVLTHPDFNLQNILVGEDGTLQGLIDWDGVSTVPRSVGCPFPKWLTFDWDPANYDYTIDEEDRCCEARHHPPDEMKRYREMYANFVENAASDLGARLDTPAATFARVTRESLLFESLDRAAKDPFSISHAVIAIIDKIAYITSRQSPNRHDDDSDDTSEGSPCSDLAESRKKTSVDVVEDHSSSQASSTYSSSDVSEVSRVISPSTTHTDTSFPGRQQGFHTMRLSNSDPGRIQKPRETQMGTISTEKKPEDAEHNHKRAHTPGWLRQCRLFVRANLRRISGRNFQQEVPLHSSDAGSAVKSLMNDPLLGPSASPSSMDPLNKAFPPAPSDSLEDEISPNGVCFIADSSLLLSKSDTGGALSAPPPSKAQEDKALHLGQEHEEPEISTPLCHTTSAVQMPHNASFQQRLKAKWASCWGLVPNKPRINPESSLKDREEAQTGPTRVSSGRKRIVVWIKRTGRKDPGSNQIDLPVSALEADLPRIPEVSIVGVSKMNASSPESSNALESECLSLQDALAPDHGSFTEEEKKTWPQEVVEEDLDTKLYKERFLPNQIYNDMADGILDEIRVQRLRLGFAALLDSL